MKKENKEETFEEELEAWNKASEEDFLSFENWERLSDEVWMNFN